MFCLSDGVNSVLRVLKYPHPALRHKSKPLRRVDTELKNTVREMFDLMYENKGIGLAANQVDLPYRFFILNTEGDPEKGEEYVFINPVIIKRSGTAEADEGCLSFPEIYAPVKRSAKIVIAAYDLDGKEVNYEFERAVRPRSPARIRPPGRDTLHRPAYAHRPVVGQRGPLGSGAAIRGRSAAGRHSRRSTNRLAVGGVGIAANLTEKRCGF